MTTPDLSEKTEKIERPARFKMGQLATMNNDPYFEQVHPNGECDWWVQIYDMTTNPSIVAARVYGPDPESARQNATTVTAAMNGAFPEGTRPKG